MSRPAFTLRIDSAERAALDDLSEIEGRPVNQIVNDAVRNYLARRGEKETSLQDTLARLRAYREKDPNYKQAFAELIEAEVTFDDPLEGVWFEEKSSPKGPAQSKVRELLGVS